MQVPKISQTPTPVNPLPSVNLPVNAPIEAFGGGAEAAAAAQAGQTLDHETRNFALQQENHANTVAVTNAISASLQRKNDLLYNPKSGLITKQGANAFGADEEIGSAYKGFQDDVVNSLQNDHQKATYLEASQKIGMDLNEAVQKHVFVQTKNYDDQVSASAIATAQDNAEKNWQDSGTVEKSIEDQRGLILKNAERNGQPTKFLNDKGEPTMTGMAFKNAASTTISKVVNNMLASNMDEPAQALFDKYNNTGLISGEDSTKLIKNLEEGSTRVKSQRLTDQYTASKINDAGQPIPNTQPTEQQALAKANQEMKDDPKLSKLRDATVARIKDFYSTQKVAQAQDRDTAFESAWNKVAQSKSMDSVSPAELQSLAPAQQKALSGALHMTETNPEKYYQFQKMAADPSQRAAFLKLGFSDLRPHLSDEDMKQVGSWQAGIQKQDTATVNKLDGYRSDASIVNDSLTAAGYKTNAKPGTQDAKDVALFRGQVDEQVRQIQERTGKKATNKDIQEVTDKLLVNSITSRGFLWNSTKPAFKLQPGDQPDFDIKDVPKAEKNKIISALQRANQTVNDAAIVDVFKRRMSQ